MVEYKNHYIHNKWEIVYEKDGVIKMNAQGMWASKDWNSFKNTLREPILPISPAKLLAIIQIQRLAIRQREVFKEIEEILSIIPNNLKDKFDFIRDRFICRNVKLYDQAKDKVQEAINDDSDYYSIVAVVDSYQEMMDLLLEDIKNASLVEEQLEGIKALLDWVLNAPSGFAKRLRPFGFKIVFLEGKEYSYRKVNYQPKEQSEKTASLIIAFLKGANQRWTQKSIQILSNQFN